MSAPYTDRAGPTVGVTTDRFARVSPAARAVHRQVLTAFAATGTPSGRDMLDEAASGCDLDVLLRELHDRDVVRLDPHGAIQAAYPFSARPTPHVVHIADGPSVYAMCAIDALGIAAMLHRDISIDSTDPHNGQPISVTVHNGRSRWTLGSAVVVEGAITGLDGDCCPPGAPADVDLPAAQRCCGVLNFFTEASSAAAWLAAHPEVTGAVLTQKKALRISAAIFGHLLDT